MAHDLGHDDLRQAWQEHSTEEVRMSIHEIRARIHGFERTIRRRNLREYVAGGLVVAFFSASAWFENNTTVAVGNALVVLAALWVMHTLRTRGSTSPLAETLGAMPCLDFHRAELGRQRVLLRNIWAWYLLPFVPGMLCTVVGRAIEHPEHRLGALWQGLMIGFVFLAIGALNQRAARQLQRQIDEVDALR